jgi:hypothetical protein
MVIFDLICLNGHRFEGWFADLTDLEAQLAGGGLICPICGDENVARRPSTFGMVRKRVERRGSKDLAEPEASDLDPETFKAFKKLAELSERLEKDFVDVGAGFASEALKMRYGVAPLRNIRGHSTADEEETLRGEGIEFFKLPMLSRKNTAS